MFAKLGDNRLMRTITTAAELDQARQAGALVMFGGATCSVCAALKPKLEALLAEEFPLLEAVYLDCQGEAETVCAQERIFSLPVVQVWFEGKKFAEMGRSFSLSQLRSEIARPYQLAFE